MNPRIKLRNQVVCFTGKSLFTRIEMQRLAQSVGASISHQITSKTTLLVVGKKSGSKLERAFIRNIHIMADDEFLKRVKKG